MMGHYSPPTDTNDGALFLPLTPMMGQLFLPLTPNYTLHRYTDTYPSAVFPSH
ncbi:unnamed protein product, partial [Staurois parvus]